MEKRVLITNIQRFSLHDGPGIRTTVFCKGCSLRCPWCANPENFEPFPEKYVKDGREGIYGRYVTCEELYDEVMKDRGFYNQQEQKGALAGLPGGVTFSGGEPLLQMQAIEPLLRQLKKNGIHVCAETALFIPENFLKIALEYIDLFFVDVKILNAAKCYQVLGGDLKQYEANVSMLFAAGKPVVFRAPVIGGMTDGLENRQAIAAFVKSRRPVKMELIKGHNLGDAKYTSLGKVPAAFNDVDDTLLRQYKQEMEIQACVQTEICQI